MAVTALDRDALYYPRIHVRDVNWLKATLLSFPHVRRMLPPWYPPRDSPEVTEFRDTLGPNNEPLLQDEIVDTESVFRAQGDLKARLEHSLDHVSKLFSRLATEQEYGAGVDQFEIHVGKMPGLVRFLTDNRLAWPSRRNSGRDSWLAVHPRMGEAIMSSIAVALANDKGLDIVTDESRIHRALVTQEPDDVFDELMGTRSARAHSSRSDPTDEVVQVIMRSQFDVRKLSAVDIAAILADGNDLRRFKTAIVPLVQAIPEIADPEERQKRIRRVADEVMNEWKAYRKGLGKALAKSLVKATKLDAPNTFLTGLAGTSAHWLIADQGLSIGLATYAGLSVLKSYREERNRPVKYLSAVEKHAPFVNLAIGT